MQSVNLQPLRSVSMLVLNSMPMPNDHILEFFIVLLLGVSVGMPVSHISCTYTIHKNIVHFCSVIRNTFEILEQCALLATRTCDFVDGNSIFHVFIVRSLVLLTLVYRPYLQFVRHGQRISI